MQRQRKENREGSRPKALTRLHQTSASASVFGATSQLKLVHPASPEFVWRVCLVAGAQCAASLASVTTWEGNSTSTQFLSFVIFAAFLYRWLKLNLFCCRVGLPFPFFPKALRRVLPENPLNTYTSTLTLMNTYTSTLTLTHTHTLEERKHPSAKYASVKVCKCKYASMICKGEYASTQ